MKQMTYFKSRRKGEVLHTGFYKDTEFVIVSLGTHPCAYINTKIDPVDAALRVLHYDDFPIPVHGGLTFASGDPHFPTQTKGYWVGWDYAHCGDYTGNSIFNDDESKRWTTEEIFEDVKVAIDMLPSTLLAVDMEGKEYD